MFEYDVVQKVLHLLGTMRYIYSGGSVWSETEAISLLPILKADQYKYRGKETQR